MNKREKRTAIAVHHTGTSSAAWDGPENEKRLKLDQQAGYYEHAFAWRDSAGDGTKKQDFKFIHHEVSADGAVGAASIEACRSGIAVLNGARKGTTIPHHDRQGVYNHLAAHLRDAKVEPPELKSYTGELERRTIVAAEFRVASDKKSIEGYAAVFNSMSEPMMGFREKIAPGAFAKTIKEHDIRALFNHDPNYVLGRNKAGTLDLSEDSKGLQYRIKPSGAQWVRDLMESMERGDVNQSSFGFRTIKDTWENSNDAEDGESDDDVVRTLLECRLFDVSPVTFPAYTDTESGVRGLALLETYKDGVAMNRALFKLQAGSTLEPKELDLIRAHISDLEERLEAQGGAAAPSPVSISPKEPEQQPAPHSLDHLRRQLEIAALE